MLRIRNLRQYCGLRFSEHLWCNCWAIPSSLFKPDGTRDVKILLGIFWVQLSFAQIFPKRDFSECAWYLQERAWISSKLGHDSFLLHHLQFNVTQYNEITRVLGAFAKLRSDYWFRHVCPSARNSATTGWIFIKFDFWIFLENLSRKSKIRYKRTRIKGTLHEDKYTFSNMSRPVLLRMKKFQSFKETWNTFYFN